MTPTGSEHCTFPRGNTTITETGVTNSATLGSNAPELDRVINRWPTLPKPIKRAIMALVE